MAQVRFNLKDSKGLILLKYRFHRGKLPFVYSTRQYISPEQWDFRRMRAKTGLKHPINADLNRFLDFLEGETLKICRDLIISGVKPTKEALKLHLDTITFKVDPAGVQFFDYLKNIVTELINSPKTPKNTVDNYKGAVKILENYCAARKKPLNWDDVTFVWLKDFETWCYSENYSPGTVGKYVSIVKAVVNKGRKEGLTGNRIVTERGFSVSATETNKMVLTLDDLEQIYAIDWERIDKFEGMTGARLAKVAAIIIAGSWSGLRHSDLHKINRITAKNGNLEVWTGKTGALISVPIFTPLQNLLDKYQYDLPTATRSEVLRVGQMVLKYAEVNEQIIWKDSKGGKSRTYAVRKWEKFSSHVMRRTFATNFYLLGVDPARIMSGTGHTTQEQLMRYINAGKWLGAEHAEKIQAWKIRLGLTKLQNYESFRNPPALKT